MKEAKITSDQIEQAIIGMIGAVDAPISDEKSVSVAMQRFLIGVNDDWRQKRRDEVLNLSVDDFHVCGEKFEEWPKDWIRGALTNQKLADEWHEEDKEVMIVNLEV